MYRCIDVSPTLGRVVVRLPELRAERGEMYRCIDAYIERGEMYT